jgi:hypothetical protein
LLHNAIFVIQKERFMIRSLMSILILTLSLSHCSSTDVLNIGAAMYGGMEKKPNPMGAIKLLKKKDKDE